MSIILLSQKAQRAANREGKPYAVFNLNRVGQALYVIREAGSFPGENRMVLGPFEPEAPCKWFMMCPNAATRTVPHPILGNVPCCERCAKFALDLACEGYIAGRDY